MRLWDAGNAAADGFIRSGRRRQTPEPAGKASGPLPPLRCVRTKGPVRRSLPTISAVWKKELMISPETRVEIRRYFYAEHWKIGTIARELNVHPDAVRNAIESDRFNRTEPMRPSITDPYMEFVRQTLDRHPRLRATRLHQMIRDRGYTGSIIQLRRAVARLRPPAREPFLKLQAFPAEPLARVQPTSSLMVLASSFRLRPRQVATTSQINAISEAANIRPPLRKPLLSPGFATADAPMPVPE